MSHVYQVGLSADFESCKQQVSAFAKQKSTLVNHCWQINCNHAWEIRIQVLKLGYLSKSTSSQNAGSNQFGCWKQWHCSLTRCVRRIVGIVTTIRVSANVAKINVKPEGCKWATIQAALDRPKCMQETRLVRSSPEKADVSISLATVTRKVNSCQILPMCKPSPEAHAAKRLLVFWSYVPLLRFFQTVCE